MARRCRPARRDRPVPEDGLLTVGPAAAEVLAAIHAEAFETPWSAAEIADLLRLDSVSGLLLQAEGTEAGFVLLQLAADEAEILTIAVRPRFRRRGAGRRLLGAAMALACAAGAARLLLEVAEDNAPALALYARLGLARLARRRGYYRGRDGRLQDALVLARELPPGAEELAAWERQS